MTLSTAEETEHSRVRSVSPSVCMHPEHPVHSTHIGYEGSSAHKENVVRSSDVNLTNSSPDGSVLFDEFKSSLSSSSKENDEKILPGKLKVCIYNILYHCNIFNFLIKNLRKKQKNKNKKYSLKTLCFLPYYY